MPGKPAVDSKGGQVLARGQTAEELEQIRGFKEVCKKDNIVMRKAILDFIRQFNKAHHWPPGNPQHNIDEPAWSATEQLGEEAAVESDDDVRPPDVPIDAKAPGKVAVETGKWEPCDLCNGTGFILAGACSRCGGSGKIWVLIPLKRPETTVRRRGLERSVR